MERLKEMMKSYEKWVATNPETVGDVETTTKWISYFIAGRISDSNIVSELIYSLSNMLVLYNDRIIAKAREYAEEAAASLNEGPATSRQMHQQMQRRKDERFCYRLKVMITTLEYSEVFIEISAKRVFGSKGKWIIIALLQLFKAAGRFFILKHSTHQIITSPAMPSLNRRAFIKSAKQQQNVTGTTSRGISNKSSSTEARLMPEHSITFQLKRSGRIIRKVEGAPPLQYRDFNLLNGADNEETSSNRQMSSALVQAEYLYIAKPLIHLAAMGVFGEKRWKQYIIALALDLCSIRMYHKNRSLMTKEQRLEMSRRCVNLLLYLMRSPFYERYTESRLEGVLNFVANNVPLVKLIAGPLRDYIPHWQSTYFYLWST